MRDETQKEWVIRHFGPEARVTSHCKCGRTMGRAEYYYHGGTFGFYTCKDCECEWVVDLNGAMWPK